MAYALPLAPDGHSNPKVEFRNVSSDILGAHDIRPFDITLYGMKYLDVLWRHEIPEEPIRLVSEVDEDGWEKRKLEFFANGHVGYASASYEFGGTGLGVAPVPVLSEINALGEFEGREIDAATFESLWKQHASHAT